MLRGEIQWLTNDPGYNWKCRGTRSPQCQILFWDFTLSCPLKVIRRCGTEMTLKGRYINFDWWNDIPKSKKWNSQHCLPLTTYLARVIAQFLLFSYKLSLLTRTLAEKLHVRIDKPMALLVSI